jgi:phosphatidylinositol alpha-mannosyltransferase
MPLPASRSKLKRYMSDEQFDVLHVQTPYSPLMGEQLIFLADKRTAIIGTFHIVPSSIASIVGNWLLGNIWCHFSIKHFDKMISVSPAAKRVAKRDFRIDSEVLPNVIDYDKFKLAEPLKKYDDSKITIVFLGRLVPRKGCQYLLRAINRIVKNKNDLPDFRLVICGGGPKLQEMRDYVIKHKLENLVEFTGFVDEAIKPRYYASADIAVFPSTGGESFGIVLVEAMATGRTAVIAGDNEGYKALMTEGSDVLFDPKNIDEFAAKLEAYIKDKKKRSQAIRWQSAYSKSFDTKVVGQKLLDIYASVCEKKKSEG